MSERKRERLNNFNKIIKDIKNTPYFQMTQNFKHHGPTNTIYNHSIKTAYVVFIFCLIFRINYKLTISAVIAALLHDFFGYDWTDPQCKQNIKHRQEKGLQYIKTLHAFNHGAEAVTNSLQYFELNENQKDAILKHMFPLYPIPPKHIEGWLVTIADKIVATQECLTVPFIKLKMAIT